MASINTGHNGTNVNSSFTGQNATYGIETTQFYTTFNTNFSTTYFSTTLDELQKDDEPASILPLIISLICIGVILTVIFQFSLLRRVSNETGRMNSLCCKKSKSNEIVELPRMEPVRSVRATSPAGLDGKVLSIDMSLGNASRLISLRGKRAVRANTFSHDTSLRNSAVLLAVDNEPYLAEYINENEQSSDSMSLQQEMDSKQEENNELEQIRECKQFGISNFENILSIQNNEDKRQKLIDPLTWERFIDSVCLNMEMHNIEQKIKILKGMKTVTQNISRGDNPKYKIIKTDSDQFNQKYAAIDGGTLFFKGIGYRDDFRLNELVCPDPDFVINEVVIGCLLHKINLLKIENTLQRAWSESIKKLYNNFSFNNDENSAILNKVASMDIINDHGDYYKLSKIVMDVCRQNFHSAAVNINDTSGQREIVWHLLTKLGFKLMTKFSFGNKNSIVEELFNVYNQVVAMEQMKIDRKDYIHSMSMAAPVMDYNRRVSVQLVELGGPLKIQKSVTTSRMVDNVLEFGQDWNSKYDESFQKQALTDDDIAQIYESGDIYDAEDKLLTKLYEMSANIFQMDEYLNYVYHFKDIKKENNMNRVCKDKKCKWNKEEYENKLYSLTRTQLVHVMFYHSKDYSDLSRAVRKGRYIQYITPGGPGSNAIENKEEEIKEKESDNINVDEINETCEFGNECQFLNNILSKCRTMNDIKKWQNTTATKEDDDDIAHCLYYHEKYREKCQINDCIFSKSQNVKINRYAQFHLQFFHNQAIDDDDKEGTIKEQKAEKIEYKPANIKTGVLQFGTPFVIDDEHDAKFKNPKEEMLKNNYHSLKVIEWNTLIKNCRPIQQSSKKAKQCKMKVKDLVAIKLYTDFDELQKVFKLCFRSSIDKIERRERQRHFYHWHICLKKACGKSKDVINQKLYHGVNCILSPSTMNGTYYGPVSTTTDYKIAQKFAGKDGQILEVYPSFGRHKGLDVSWLSNFPDECEVLFYNTSFQIAQILDGVMPESEPVSYIEQSIFNSIGSINVNSNVISLNEKSTDTPSGTFQNVDNYDKLSILYLLYVQYKPSEWDKIQKEKSSFFINAIMKFRDQFITLAQRVEAVSMDNMSKLLQMFFYSDLTKYSLPILSNGQTDSINEMENKEKEFVPNQFFNFSTIVRLFPCAKQITVNADNFDWSLNKFIHFLSLYDFEFHHIKLQDIFIRNIKEKNAQKSLIQNNARDNLYKLGKMGWKFSTPLHLHRCDVEPLPELPFLFVFVDWKRNQKDEQAALVPSRKTLHMFRTNSQRLLFESAITPQKYDEDDDDKKETPTAQKEQAFELVVVDHNPKNCILSKRIFEKLEYKQPLIEILEWRLSNLAKKYVQFEPGFDERTNKFIESCLKVESLVLDPLPRELYKIFYAKNKYVSFEAIIKLFPKLTDLFLCSTTLSPMICFKFIAFAKEYNENEGIFNLQRIFYSKQKPLKQRDVALVKMRLKEIGWNFVKSQQMICKY